MQQRPPFVPSANFSLLIAAVLGLSGIFDLAMGASYRMPGPILTGLAAIAYAVLLVRDALHIRKTGQRLMAPRSMAKAGFACLGVYLLGLILKFTWAPA
jgi:crotonobetainyl-CoA:carnitine CoA-transferase CaiB-like acyl-CoA transferase